MRTVELVFWDLNLFSSKILDIHTQLISCYFCMPFLLKLQKITYNFKSVPPWRKSRSWT